LTRGFLGLLEGSDFLTKEGDFGEELVHFVAGFWKGKGSEFFQKRLEGVFVKKTNGGGGLRFIL
jgi:hypothetical protein